MSTYVDKLKELKRLDSGPISNVHEAALELDARLTALEGDKKPCSHKFATECAFNGCLGKQTDPFTTPDPVFKVVENIINRENRGLKSQAALDTARIQELEEKVAELEACEGCVAAEQEVKRLEVQNAALKHRNHNQAQTIGDLQQEADFMRKCRAGQAENIKRLMADKELLDALDALTKPTHPYDSRSFKFIRFPEQGKSLRDIFREQINPAATASSR